MEMLLPPQDSILSSANNTYIEKHGWKNCVDKKIQKEEDGEEIVSGTRKSNFMKRARARMADVNTVQHALQYKNCNTALNIHYK